MRDGPQAEGHFTRDQDVCVVKEVDVAPGQRTVLLEGVQRQTQVETSPVRISSLIYFASPVS